MGLFLLFQGKYLALLDAPSACTRSKLLCASLVFELKVDFFARRKHQFKNPRLAEVLELVSSTQPTSKSFFSSLEQLDKKLETLGIIEVNSVMLYPDIEETHNV